MVYKTKKGEGKGDWKNDSKIISLGHVREDSLFKLGLQLQPLYAKIQYFGPRFRLAFSPALYKFIIWATWAWIHSYSGFKSNLVLTVGFFNVILIWLMLTSAFRILINNSFQESFVTTFIGNEKNCQNINCFFFSIKTFFKLITNQYPKGIRQHFPFNIYTYYFNVQN